ncbi:MAG: nucleotidyltransferase domain-containing protein [Alphaproteobacteria bacterium]
MQILSEHSLDAAASRALTAFLDRVAAVFAVRHAILFGSRARGEFQPESDADVAVLLSGPHGQFMAAKLAMADIAFDVMLETGIRIESLPVWGSLQNSILV